MPERDQHADDASRRQFLAKAGKAAAVAPAAALLLAAHAKSASAADYSQGTNDNDTSANDDA